MARGEASSRIVRGIILGSAIRSANQKQYQDLGSETSSVWDLCRRSPDVISQGNHLVALRNVGYFLRPLVGV